MTLPCKIIGGYSCFAAGDGAVIENENFVLLLRDGVSGKVVRISATPQEQERLKENPYAWFEILAARFGVSPN